MPLFGHKHHDNATSNTGQDNSNVGYDDNAGYSNSGGGGNRLHKNQGPHNDSSPNAPGTGYGQQERGVGIGSGAGVDQQGGFNNNTADTTTGGYGRPGKPGYGSGGPAGATDGGAAHHGMNPQTDAMGRPAQPHTGGGGSRFAGKVETAVGTMFGSESLKRKGLEKEQESQALKVQAAELSEAERLEQAALARRERAVAHGAHPDHRHLGSHNPDAGATNVNELGGGANTGVGGVGGAGSGARGGY